MRVTVDFLEGVHEHLLRLAGNLEDQERSTRRLLRNVRDHLDVANRNWVGPRSDRVLANSRRYVRDVRPYPDAVASGAATLRRWAWAAKRAAEELARLRSLPTADFIAVDDGRADRPVPRCTPAGAIHEFNQQWNRTCERFGSELDTATKAIRKTNSATVFDISGEEARSLRAELALANLRGPEHVAAWWSQIGQRNKLILLSSYPGLLRGVEGLPAPARRMARRTDLMNQLPHLERLDGAGQLTAQQRQRMLHIRARLDDVDGDVDRRDDVTLVAMPVPSATVIEAEPVDVAEFVPSGPR